MLSHIRFLEGYIYYCFPGGAVVKNPPASAGDARDAGLIPGLRRFLGVGISFPVYNPLPTSRPVHLLASRCPIYLHLSFLLICLCQALAIPLLYHCFFFEQVYLPYPLSYVLSFLYTMERVSF